MIICISSKAFISNKKLSNVWQLWGIIENIKDKSKFVQKVK